MRSPKGKPSISSTKGRLQIRVTYQGKRYTLSVGLEDTVQNRKLAQELCNCIERDISLQTFDTSLKIYRDKTPNGHKEVKETVKPNTLLDLWDRYVVFKSPQVEETTISIKYANVRNWLERCPFKTPNYAIDIRDWLLTETSVANTKTLLMQINSCCKWAKKSQLLDSNPFDGLGSDLIDKKTKDDIDPFTKGEMIAIVEEFRARKDHYADFVEFLFKTGCRSSEAVGLQWKHISQDLTKIKFERALVKFGSRYISKRLKTQESREFPINQSLRELLLRIRPDNYEPEDLVFKPSDKSTVKNINLGTFLPHHWLPVINHLIEAKRVERYRPQYNTRHTFITLAIQAGVDIPTIAKWVGNSPKTIFEHYAGFNKQGEVPEF